MSNSSVQKGKLLENYIAGRIRDLGLDPKAGRVPGSGNGNREKEDIRTNVQIFGRQIGIEAKNQATLHIPEWWRQTQKLEDLGLEPVLAFKQYGESLDGTKVVIYLETFLRLIRAANSGRIAEKVKDARSIAQDLRAIAEELSPTV